MTKDEALKLALEALESAANNEGNFHDYRYAATALRQAIEQAEKQEPYAYIYETNGPFGVHQSLRHEQYNGRYPDKTIPVYTAPMSIKPENIDAKSAHVDPVDIKPVAWSVLNKRTGTHWYTHESRYTAQYYANEFSHRESDNTPSMVVTPLYTAPPKRDWQGLTDEDYKALEIETLVSNMGYREVLRWADKRLKEKNHVD